MIDNYNTTDASSLSGAASSSQTALKEPNATDVSAFNSALSDGSQGNEKSCTKDAADSTSGAEAGSQSGDEAILAQLEEILTMLMELIAQLNGSEGDSAEGSGSESAGQSVDASGTGGTANNGASTSGTGDSPAKVENGKVTSQGEGNVAAGDGQIPKPTEHMQSFDLGDKQVTIGGDGSASAEEVQQTQQTISDLYENSPSFKEMVDSSPNDSFEVSVGRRSDNMSWGNEDGRVFMNVNDITPGSSTNFQELTAHEFAHAGVGQDHGAEMERFQSTVAQEA